VTRTDEPIASRDRLHKAYASQQPGRAESGPASVYRRDIRPALPRPSAGLVIDIGCGQGDLVRLLAADGYDAEGIDVSPVQVARAHAAGIDRVLLGDYRDLLAERKSQLAAVTAIDLLEHLPKDEVLDTLDHVARALAPGGVFIARVPNAASPLGGYVRYGDFTQESSYTARSVRQITAAAGFWSVTVRPCPPAANGFMSAARVAAWKPVSGLCKIALAAETGVLRGHVVTQNLTFVARKA
jgi:2-polyprenyl-3-methyl-5-hydroxy-6-metoxy-1,4-benzoquinol methylase